MKHTNKTILIFFISFMSLHAMENESNSAASNSATSSITNDLTVSPITSNVTEQVPAKPIIPIDPLLERIENLPLEIQEEIFSHKETDIRSFLKENCISHIPLQDFPATPSNNPDCFTSDGKYFIMQDGEFLKVWDTTSGVLLHALPFKNRALHFSAHPHTPSIVMADMKNAQLLDAQTGKLSTIACHNLIINGLTFSPSGNYLASASTADIIRVCRFPSRECVYEAPHYSLTAIQAFSPYDKMFAYAVDNKLHIVNLESGKVTHSIACNGRVTSCLFHSFNKHIIVATQPNNKKDDNITMYDCTTGNVVKSTRVFINATKLTTNKDNSLLFASENRKCVCIDLKKMNVRNEYQLPQNHTGCILSSDGEYFISLTKEKNLIINARSSSDVVTEKALFARGMLNNEISKQLDVVARKAIPSTLSTIFGNFSTNNNFIRIGTILADLRILNSVLLKLPSLCTDDSHYTFLLDMFAQKVAEGNYSTSDLDSFPPSLRGLLHAYVDSKKPAPTPTLVATPSISSLSLRQRMIATWATAKQRVTATFGGH